jgi:hypothetical protein
MSRLNMNDARCEALFASALQRSDALTAEAVAAEISRTVRKFGLDGCADRMAQEFGDHPEAACERMRWARDLVGQLTADPCLAPVVIEAGPHVGPAPAGQQFPTPAAGR